MTGRHKNCRNHKIPAWVLAFWQQKNKNAALISTSISFSTVYPGLTSPLNSQALMFLWLTLSTAFGDMAGMHIKVVVLAGNKWFFSKRTNFINPGSCLHRWIEETEEIFCSGLAKTQIWKAYKTHIWFFFHRRRPLRHVKSVQRDASRELWKYHAEYLPRMVNKVPHTASAHVSIIGGLQVHHLIKTTVWVD